MRTGVAGVFFFMAALLLPGPASSQWLDFCKITQNSCQKRCGNGRLCTVHCAEEYKKCKAKKTKAPAPAPKPTPQ